MEMPIRINNKHRKYTEGNASYKCNILSYLLDWYKTK